MIEMVKSKVIRIGLEYIEKLEMLEKLCSDKTKRQVAEKIIAEFFARVMNNEESAKQILEIEAELRIRQQEMELQWALRTKDSKIVRVED